MNSSKISIFIADNHPSMQETLAAPILQEVDMEIVGIETNGTKAIKTILLIQPSIVIIGLILPSIDTLLVIKRLSQLCPQTSILVFDRLGKDKSVFAAVQAGAKSYLTKGTQDAELINTIRILSKGQSYLPDEVVEIFIEGLRHNQKRKKITPLSMREKEVLILMGQGFSDDNIYQKMKISKGTLRVYFHKIIKKMDFKNKVEMMNFAKYQVFEK